VADPRVILYAVPWCTKCRRLRICLETSGVAFLELNPEEDPAVARELASRTGGTLDVPAVRPGERFLLDPDDAALADLLGMAIPGPMDVYDVAFLGAGQRASPGQSIPPGKYCGQLFSRKGYPEARPH
jgi:glutaredoxin